jgi:hypothetical protein
MKLYSLIITLVVWSSSWGQDSSNSNLKYGSISGVVFDSIANESLPSAYVFLVNTSYKTAVDFDGNFTFSNVPKGSYVLLVKSSGYIETTFNINLEGADDVQLTCNLMPLIIDHGASEAVEIVHRRTQEKAFEMERRNNTSVSDGMTSKSLSKMPVTTAADGLKKVSGTSIQDGKFVVIRGLNDRYNMAYLNGAQLPSSEADRKAFSFDIFPVNMVDNITILKTGSPELPADFAGGVIQIATKGIPDSSFQQIGIGGSYNTITTFQNRQYYQGGKLDWIGFDDNSRALPSAIPSKENFPSLMNDQAEIAKSYTSDWSILNKQFMPNFNGQYSLGVKSKLFNKEVGMLGSLTYNRRFDYSETIRRSYTNNEAGGADAIQLESDLLDKTYTSSLLAGGMLNFSMKLNKNHQISFKNLYSINSSDKVIERSGELSPLEVNPTLLKSSATCFTGNYIYSGQLIGESKFLNDRLNLEWVGGLSNVQRVIPGMKRNVYTRLRDFNDPSDPNPYDTMYVANISGSNVGPDYGGGMFFSQNKEVIGSLSTNLSYEVDSILGVATLLKFGGLIQERNRNFDARQLGYTKYGVVGGNINFDNSLLFQSADSIFSVENMGEIRPGVGGFKLTDGTKYTDSYQASSSLNAGYLGIQNSFLSKFKIYYGVRIEDFKQVLSTRLEANRDLHLETQKLDLLPTVNFIFSPTRKQNIRLSAYKTLNRPEYRELAPFAFYDFSTQFVMSGNKDLVRASISNFDFRYEWFPGKGQVLSGTYFYKNFSNPIEQIARPDVAKEISYQNAPQAINYGFEFEFKSVIGLLIQARKESFLNNLTLYSNFAVVRSKVDVSDNIGTLYDSRPLQGQSPYVFNGGVLFDDIKNDMSYSLIVNTVGQRIAIIGSSQQPDIWEMGRTFLDFQVSKTFFNEKLSLKFNIQNILAQNQVFYQNNENEDLNGVFKQSVNQVFTGDKTNASTYQEGIDNLIWSTGRGRQLSFKLSYRF